VQRLAANMNFMMGYDRRNLRRFFFCVGGGSAGRLGLFRWAGGWSRGWWPLATISLLGESTEGKEKDSSSQKRRGATWHGNTPPENLRDANR
jgi:hypothetical protein